MAVSSMRTWVAARGSGMGTTGEGGGALGMHRGGGAGSGGGNDDDDDGASRDGHDGQDEALLPGDDATTGTVNETPLTPGKAVAANRHAAGVAGGATGQWVGPPESDAGGMVEEGANRGGEESSSGRGDGGMGMAGAAAAEAMAGKRPLAAEEPLVPANQMSNVKAAPQYSEKLECARQRIAANKYDTEAWSAVVADAQSLPIAKARPLFEQFLAAFPTSGQHWRAYVLAEMSAGNDVAVKAIFSRCLLLCPYVGLWRTYLSYILKLHRTAAGGQKEPGMPSEVKKAFDFTLEHVGMDMQAGVIWQEYLAALAAVKASGHTEESQKTLSLRRVYQRLVATPIHGCEAAWREYEAFENGLNKQLAKGLLAEHQPRHMSARAVYAERRKLYEPLNLTYLAAPPSGSFQEQQQFHLWSKLVAFEKKNPQRLEPDALLKRICFTYDQWLMCFHQHPDVYYDYAMWLAEANHEEVAVRVFKRAVKALPGCAAIHYAYADFEEARGNGKAALAVYQSFLKDGKGDTLSHIQYMKLCRRTQGIEAARKAFMEHRKSPTCSWHLFVAAAHLEMFVDKDVQVARKLFEAGLKRFLQEPAFVLQYADFLVHINDSTNARVLFEQVLSTLPPDKSHEIWQAYIKFECLHGDMASVIKLERRRDQALSAPSRDAAAGAASSESKWSRLQADAGLGTVVRRHAFLDLLPLGAPEMLHVAAQEQLANTLQQQQQQAQAAQQAGAQAGLPPQPQGRPADAGAAPAASADGPAVTPTAAGITLSAVSLSSPAPPAFQGTQAGAKAPPTRGVPCKHMPDTSRMVVYDPRGVMGLDGGAGKGHGAGGAAISSGAKGGPPTGQAPYGVAPAAGKHLQGGLRAPMPQGQGAPPGGMRRGPPGAPDAYANALPPFLVDFMRLLPSPAEFPLGPVPDVDYVMHLIESNDFSPAAMEAGAGPMYGGPPMAGGGMGPMDTSAARQPQGGAPPPHQRGMGGPMWPPSGQGSPRGQMPVQAGPPRTASGKPPLPADGPHGRAPPPGMGPRDGMGAMGPIAEAEPGGMRMGRPSGPTPGAGGGPPPGGMQERGVGNAPGMPRKRKPDDGEMSGQYGGSSEDVGMDTGRPIQPPPKDIYRSRQKQKKKEPGDMGFF
eukprot:jgi/Mesvir1/11706/Mv00094-RA.2